MHSRACAMLALPAVLLMLTATGLAAEGQSGTAGDRSGSSPHRGMRGHALSFSPLDFKDQLKLSKEQQETIEPIQSQYKKTTQQKEATIRDAFEDLGSLLEQPSPDSEKLKQKVKEISELREGMMLYRIETLIKLRNVLTEEQQQRYRALLAENLERFGQGAERHRGAATTP